MERNRCDRYRSPACGRSKVPLSSLASAKNLSGPSTVGCALPRHDVLLGRGIVLRGFAGHPNFDILSTGELPPERSGIAAIVPANPSRSHVDLHHFFLVAGAGPGGAGIKRRPGQETGRRWLLAGVSSPFLSRVMDSRRASMPFNANGLAGASRRNHSQSAA